MKRLIGTSALVFGLVCVGSVQAANFETYSVDLRNGYELVAFVGNTPAEYAKAQHMAKMWETQRHLGLGPQTITAVALDNSTGVAKQLRLNVPENAIAYVNVH